MTISHASIKDLMYHHGIVRQFKLSCSCCGEVTRMKKETAESYLHEGKTSPCCNTSCYCLTDIKTGASFANTLRVAPQFPGLPEPEEKFPSIEKMRRDWHEFENKEGIQQYREDRKARKAASFAKRNPSCD